MMSEETNELNDKDVQRIADALYKKMKEKQEKEAQEKLEKEKGSETPKGQDWFAICTDCGKPLTYEEHGKPACPRCGGTKARIITK